MSAVAHIKQYKTGRFYSDEFRGEISWNGYEYNVLLRNEGHDAGGNLRFTDVAMALGADDQKDGRGVAIADYDNDGDLDIAINNTPGVNGDPERARAALLRNDIGNRRNWIAVELTGVKSNRDAVGAVATIQAGGVSQLQLVTAGSSYSSQQSGRLYFGLGDRTKVDSLTVKWPGGLVETFRDLQARQVVRIVEGAGVGTIAFSGGRR